VRRFQTMEAQNQILSNIYRLVALLLCKLMDALGMVEITTKVDDYELKMIREQQQRIKGRATN
jgi:hypothetical protein